MTSYGGQEISQVNLNEHIIPQGESSFNCWTDMGWPEAGRQVHRQGAGTGAGAGAGRGEAA